MARKKADSNAVYTDEQVISQIDRQLHMASKYARPASYVGLAALAAMILGLVLANISASGRSEASSLLGQGIKALQDGGLLAGAPVAAEGGARLPEELRTLQNEHGGTDVQALGALFQGHYHYQAREWTSAIENYKASADRLMKPSPGVGALALYNLALAHESNGQWAEALSCYAQIEGNKVALASLPAPLFATGKARALAGSGKLEEGRALLKSALGAATEELDKKSIKDALEALNLPAPVTPPAAPDEEAPVQPEVGE